MYMAEELLTQIKRSDNFPYIVHLTSTNNKGYISIDTHDWTAQMFYELPSIKFDIYVDKGGERSKYNPVSYVVDTYTGLVNGTMISVPIKNLPEDCYIYIYPIFDKEAIMARNALIKNGIEDGDIWTSETDTFDLSMTYLEGHDDVYPITTITGTSPLRFKSLGADLSDWTVYGNLTQTGVPLPDSPIVPQECGDSTANLFDGQIFTTSYPYYTTFNNGIVNVTNLVGAMYNPGTTVDIEGTTTAFLEPIARDNCSNKGRIRFILDDDTAQEMTVTDEDGAIVAASYKTFTKKIKSIRLNWTGVSTSGFAFRLTIVSGATEPASYIPYGYQLTLTANSTTQNAYLAEPIGKIGDYADMAASSGVVTRYVKKLVLTGSEENWGISGSTVMRLTVDGYLRELNTLIMCCTHFKAKGNVSSYSYVAVGECSCLISQTGNNYMYFRHNTITDLDTFKVWLATQYNAGTPVTVWYVLASPQTESFTAPTISTVKGENVLTVDTTLAPSQISITGNIKEV